MKLSLFFVIVIVLALSVPRVRWALFGNDEDGPYGIYEHTWIGAVKWWVRNPFHNLLFHVWRWEGGPFYYFGVPGHGLHGYIGFRPFTNTKGVFGIALRFS